jgi:hypothetical protein
VKIEALYFRGCPNYRSALDRLQSVLNHEGLSAEVAEIEVKDVGTARSLRFIGSPTIQVNGFNIGPDSRAVEELAFACRRYADGASAEEMIRKALSAARRR